MEGWLSGFRNIFVYGMPTYLKCLFMPLTPSSYEEETAPAIEYYWYREVAAAGMSDSDRLRAGYGPFRGRDERRPFGKDTCRLQRAEGKRYLRSCEGKNYTFTRYIFRNTVSAKYLRSVATRRISLPCLAKNLLTYLYSLFLHSSL